MDSGSSIPITNPRSIWKRWTWAEQKHRPAGTWSCPRHKPRGIAFRHHRIGIARTIRLQYRLDGVDREWLDADSSATAIYSGIPPGTHQFHVRASNSDGVWDQAGIFYNVTQEPFLYETTWFRLSALAVIGLLVAGIYRWRILAQGSGKASAGRCGNNSGDDFHYIV